MVDWKPRKIGLYDPAYEKDSCGVGFIAHVKGRAGRDIIDDALTMLRNMDHRGACGCEANTGDGAGILTGLPHEFLVKVAMRDAKIALPPRGAYGVGIVFFPREYEEREALRREVEGIVAAEGQRLLGWRRVPQDHDMCGETARAREPVMRMLFVGGADGLTGEALERKLFVIRKQLTHRLRPRSDLFYVCSLSTKVLIYKGQLTSGQLPLYFADLRDPMFASHLAMVHSRYSTNTFPSWDRAQPFRFMCHNGEINTLRGNINWLHAREGVMKSDLFGGDLEKLFPVIEPDLSDSGMFDNALELFLHTGRTLTEGIIMMIPEAWENHELMSPEKRAFYEFHAAKQEPWDGPASIAFTDGTYIGAVLDRNGLRPSRYYLTDDDRVIMASEVGVLPLPPERIKLKSRLQPGRVFLVDFTEGRIVPDEELKQRAVTRRPYGAWLARQKIELAELKPQEEPHGDEPATLLARMKAFGYTTETIQFMLLPLVFAKSDPLGSMGNDAAHACLSDQPRMVYDYFRQLFAQVTNPPLDSIREENIMSLECFIGPEGNLLDTREEDCRRLLVPHPILTNEETAAIKHMNRGGWRARTIDITFARSEGEAGLERALDRICAEASEAIAQGISLIVLSDRAVGPERVPVSALLAVGAVHHHLVRRIERTRIGIIVETGEAREVHHHCLLLGYGADAINPYVAFEVLRQARRDGSVDGKFQTDEEIVAAYRKGVAKGLLKVMGKMGISTLQSYKGAQIFEGLGLGEAVVARCFEGTPSRIKGVDFSILAREALRRHALGYGDEDPTLPNDGQFHWRADGERHGWDPPTVASLQQAARTNSREAYDAYARLADEEARARSTLRGLLKFKPLPSGPVPIDQVEPAAAIVRRFCTGAMSFGSISKEAHETLAIAMNRIGGRSNTGEGGEDPERYVPLPNGDSKRSAIKQVASARFGVTIEYLTQAAELQIKMAQGAKPGEGGELPGHKVDGIIARIRYATPGVGLISPPPHHDIYSIEDLKQLIHDLKNANPSARVSVKLVSEVGVGTIAAGVAKGFADNILISGDAGGTGASPLTSIKHAGLPWELGIAETHQTLVLNDLRSRVILQTDGGIKTGRDVVIAALLGAEEMGFSTAPLVALGCIMMRKCHLNTCPVGIATQDPVLRERFAGTPEHAINFFFLVAEHARRVMAELGFRTVAEMVGRADCLEPDAAIRHWKADGLDLAPVLRPAEKPHPKVETICTRLQEHGLERAMDNVLIEQARPALERGEPVRIEYMIRNTNRTVGTMLSHQICKRRGPGGLPPGTIHLRFDGSAGQSLGAFLARGVTIELEGDANDYVGKGLSGGRLVIYPPRRAGFKPEENVIIGNVALYGATSGEAFIRGQAAERFCVRNSGATAVIEGVGDHGCEYMTGGRAVILGPTGRNFAAGMSGGIALVWDPRDVFARHCNLGMVELERVEEPADVAELRGLLEEHARLTGSTVAQEILERFEVELGRFVKVMPVDYKRVLRERARALQPAGA
jgi:glutamate synthase (NADPH/NADH) large chain